MNTETTQAQEVQDCAVCLQKCHQLPCGQLLCVKGGIIQNKKCAVKLPPDHLDHPVVLEKALPASASPQTVGDPEGWNEKKVEIIEIVDDDTESSQESAPDTKTATGEVIQRFSSMNLQKQIRNDNSRAPEEEEEELIFLIDSL